MDIVKANHAINAFMDEMNQALHEECIPYFRKKSEYPVDRNVIYWNCVFLTSLFLKLNRLDCSKTLIDSLFPEKGSFEAVSWYYGILDPDPIERYIDSIGRLVAKSAADKGNKPPYLLPDFQRFEAVILEKNEEIKKIYFYV